MKRALGLATGLVVGLAGTALAGAMYQNTSGAVARAIRIEFSEPAEVTSMWPSLPQRDPQGPAPVIVLSGGEVPAGGWFSFTWRPDTARVVKMEWFASPPSSARPNLGFPDPRARPEVHGELLNPAFFAHPVYVMQGVSERDKVFALPLHGVPELAFYPVLGDLPAAQLTWTFGMSHPDGIGAAIEDGTLYIWGSNPEWQGYGEVRLHVSAHDGRTSSVTIPVTVFCSDRTLVNPQGKTDYFVPWTSAKDISRVLSVTAFAGAHGRDTDRLDRSVRWSAWTLMPMLRDFEFSPNWWNERVTHGWWPQAAQLRLVDIVLSEVVTLGGNAVRIPDVHYLMGLHSCEIRPVFDRFNTGASKTRYEMEYIVNEAHRLGLMVIPYVFIGVDQEAAGGFYEIYQAAPANKEAFWANYRQLVLAECERWARLGVAFFTIGQNIDLVGPDTPANRSITDEQLISLIHAIRNRHRTPILYMGGSPWIRWGGVLSTDREYWNHVDILGLGVSDSLSPLTASRDPSHEELVSGWKRRIDTLLKPFQMKYGKPLLAHDNGCQSLAGAERWGAHFCVRPEASAAELSPDVQARYFSAFFEAFRDFDGFYGPGVMWYVLEGAFTQGTVHDPGMAIRAKPVEEVIALYYGGEVPGDGITLDGSLADWPSAASVTADPVDNPGGDDIIVFRSVELGDYIFFGITYNAPPRGGLELVISTSGSSQPLRVCATIHPESQRWEAFVTYVGRERVAVGFADVVVLGNQLEMRVHRRFVEFSCSQKTVAVQEYSADWRVEDRIPGLQVIPQSGTCT
ncbi:MAG: hypothetical protein AB1543_04640 [Candidatus Bipolaricaulota bacterium]